MEPTAKRVSSFAKTQKTKAHPNYIDNRNPIGNVAAFRFRLTLFQRF
jgi:hypothetical protein